MLCFEGNPEFVCFNYWVYKVGITIPQLLHVVTCNRKNINTFTAKVDHS
jgi:hypothetical protein